MLEQGKSEYFCLKKYDLKKYDETPHANSGIN